MSAWQPIATAPSDGRKILVIGGWRTEAEIQKADGEWWRMRKRGGGTAQPTHWMPLPEPPDAD
jgi:hypothetical protein